jgi:hypothetical protein
VTRASGRAERVRIAGDRVKGCSGGSFHRSWRNVELVSAGSADAAAAISRTCSQVRRRRQGRAEAADGPGSVDTAEAHVPSTPAPLAEGVDSAGQTLVGVKRGAGVRRCFGRSEAGRVHARLVKDVSTNGYDPSFLALPRGPRADLAGHRALVALCSCELPAW